MTSTPAKRYPMEADRSFLLPVPLPPPPSLWSPPRSRHYSIALCSLCVIRIPRQLYPGSPAARVVVVPPFHAGIVSRRCRTTDAPRRNRIDAYPRARDDDTLPPRVPSILFSNFPYAGRMHTPIVIVMVMVLASPAMLLVDASSSSSSSFLPRLSYYYHYYRHYHHHYSSSRNNPRGVSRCAADETPRGLAGDGKTGFVSTTFAGRASTIHVSADNCRII